jgi:AcrR family transcriptional regulator
MQESLADAVVPAPGARRPGGRTAHNRQAVFAATLGLLAERGYAELSVEDIAQRARVHKTTIYRRWRSLDRLVAAAFMATGQSLIEVRETGDVDRDARALARVVVQALRRPEVVAAVRAVISAAPADAREQIAHQYWANRLVNVGPMIERAVARGQLPLGTDPARIIEAIAAPLYFRLLVSIEPLSQATADRAAAAALVAARAGLFGRSSARRRRSVREPAPDV